jgi:hypothetical protein
MRLYTERRIVSEAYFSPVPWWLIPWSHQQDNRIDDEQATLAIADRCDASVANALTARLKRTQVEARALLQRRETIQILLIAPSSAGSDVTFSIR